MGKKKENRKLEKKTILTYQKNNTYSTKNLSTIHTKKIIPTNQKKQQHNLPKLVAHLDWLSKRDASFGIFNRQPTL